MNLFVRQEWRHRLREWTCGYGVGKRVQFNSVQSLSRVQLFATPWTAARQASLSITNSWSLHKPMPIESVMPSSHLILCHPLLLLPSIPPSIRVFSNESALSIRLPKYWSFSFTISPSNEHSGLISFRMDWWDLLAVKGTLKSLLQHHSSKASILWCSAFFIVQLSHPYMTTGKTIALTRQTLVGKVMSLLLNMLSRLVITFLPRSNHLLVSWLQSPSAVILEPQKIKSVTISTVSPSIPHEVMGLDAMILVFWRKERVGQTERSTGVCTLPWTADSYGKLRSILCDDLEGWGWGLGGRPTRVGIWQYIWLTCFVVQQKLTSYCKAVILWLKKKRE